MPHPRTATIATLLAVFAAFAPGMQVYASAAESAASLQDLKAGFADPPARYKPMVRWWWFGASVEKAEILRELRQMKADGIGGAELAFVYPEAVDDAAKGIENLAFLSPPMLDAVSYAQAEGRKLGLRMDVTLCSGWPFGGPATRLEEAAGRLRVAEAEVGPNAASVAVPALAEGESLIAAFLAGAKEKPTSGEGNGGGWDAATARPLKVSGGSASVTPSETPRVALFFVASHTGQRVKRAAVGAEGWVLDPFSREAVATHLKHVGEPLLKAFGETPPYAIFSDSLEAYGADWTPKLPAEFKKRRGYDLIAHLPELVAGGTPEAETVRHDYGRTLTELVNENYLSQINGWALAHHTRFRSQTYGEPAVSFSSQNLAGLAEGEGPQWRAFSTLRWATSANHVFGREVSSGESFTWLHSPVFRATPLDMKAEADIDFIMGENLLIFHGWPYSAPQAGEPGWSLYAAAVFNDHNPWHPAMPAVDRYIARIGYLLSQGKAANQVAVLLPTDDAWASFAPSRVTVTGAMRKLISPELMSAILSEGYNLDYIDADAVDKLGVGHPILVLPPTDRIPLETLRKIAAFAAAGGKAISVGRAPSLDAEGKPNLEIAALSKRLFDPAHSTLLADEAALGKALRAAAAPDFDLRAGDAAAKAHLGFIRRKLAGADVYFVVNTGNQTIDAVARFATAHPSGEEWSADDGTAAPARARAEPLHLAPYQSRVFVFSDAAPAAPAPRPKTFSPLADLSAGWTVTFTATGTSKTEATLTDWTADPETLHYSGEAVYARDFTVPSPAPAGVFLEVDGGEALPGSPDSPDERPVLGANGLPDPRITRPGPGMHAYFEPPIREAALVAINGQAAGALWHPPYRLDISKLLKPGRNRIEIRVYNTALNAWSALPRRDYAPLIAKYGDRFQMQDLDKVRPISSGIVGSIHLVAGSSQ